MGIVTKSDIIRRVVSLCKNPCTVKVENVMSKPLITIGRDINILEFEKNEGALNNPVGGIG
jgi:predicted transcriptional regulator